MEFVGGQEMRWLGVENSVGVVEAGGRGQTEASKTRLQQEPQKRERRERNSHAGNRQTHTTAVDEDDGKQVMDE